MIIMIIQGKVLLLKKIIKYINEKQNMNVEIQNYFAFLIINSKFRQVFIRNMIWSKWRNKNVKFNSNRNIINTKK